MKANIIALLGLIFLMLFGCKEQEENLEDAGSEVLVATVTEDDYKIINSTFVHLVLPAPPGMKRGFGYDNFDFRKKQVPEELISNIYLTDHLLSIDDSVGFIHTRFTSSNTLSNFVSNEFQLIELGMNSGTRRSLKINVNKIINTGLYNLIARKVNPIYPYFNRSTDQNIIKQEASIISYSRIIYNQARDKACFYFEHHCYGLCGFGALIYVEREDGIWKVKKETLCWIS